MYIRTRGNAILALVIKATTFICMQLYTEIRIFTSHSERTKVKKGKQKNSIAMSALLRYKSTSQSQPKLDINLDCSKTQGILITNNR